MNNQLDQSLKQAFELIEADKHDEALRMLQPLVKTYPENPDVWWIFAHATDDPRIGREALETVTRLNSKYPGLEKLNEQLALSLPTLKNHKEEDDISGDDFMLENELKPVPQSSSRMLIWRLGGIVIGIIGITLVGLLLFNGGGNSDDNQTTLPTTESQGVAGGSTNISPTIPDSNPIPASPSRETGIDLAVFREFELAKPKLDIVDSDLGATSVLSICIDKGNLRDTLNDAMSIFANEFANKGDFDAIAISLVDCDLGQMVNTIGVSRSAVSQFTRGEIEESAFIKEWRVIIPS